MCLIFTLILTLIHCLVAVPAQMTLANASFKLFVVVVVVVLFG